MTKEPIMINDVDVSGCDFLAKEDDYCSYSGEYRAYKGQCGCSDEEMCKDHPNCFYKKALKQLKAKKQECEYAQRQVDYFKDLYSQENDNKVALEQELNQYKPILDRLLKQFETYDKLKSLDVVTFAKQTFEQLDQLKQSLLEIKEIAEGYKPYKVCGDYNNNCEPINEILQKCEVLDE